MSYLWFDGGLDEALDAMGAASPGSSRSTSRAPRPPGWSWSPSKTGVLVTGFVQTDGLVQSVNAAQLAPYDQEQVVAGPRRLLAELAQQAPTAPPA